jgi:Spy/CpxP family protein refolding chaperone
MKAGIVMLGLLTSGIAMAQNNHVHEKPIVSPYAGMQNREIKSLSPSQIEELRAGRGMSLALPAELNGYPGPSHVLDLSKELELSASQRARTQKLHDMMKREAQTAAEDVISAEKELNDLFESKRVTPQNLREVTAKAAAAQGTLRAAHLKYHLEMAALLTDAQMLKYSQLRGYR